MPRIQLNACLYQPDYCGDHRQQAQAVEQGVGDQSWPVILQALGTEADRQADRQQSEHVPPFEGVEGGP
jgi:hypothetical protein